MLVKPFRRVNMSNAVKICKDGVEAEVVDRYLGDFLREGWKVVGDDLDGNHDTIGDTKKNTETEKPVKK